MPHTPGSGSSSRDRNIIFYLQLTLEEALALDRFAFMGAVKQNDILVTLVHDGIKNMVKDECFRIETLRRAKERNG